MDIYFQFNHTQLSFRNFIPMKTKSDKQVFSEKEIQERMEQGKRISKEEFIKKFKSSKAAVAK